jgi:tetratricopeptide (TPR) repeat protein
MKMKTLLRVVVFTYAVSAFAQSPPVEIRVTGEYLIANGETAELAKQLAIVDGTSKAIQEAVSRFQADAEIKALQLKPNQIEAFFAAILETQEQAPRSVVGDDRVYRIDLLSRLDSVQVVRRFVGLRKDQDAASQLVEIWKQIQELHRELTRAGAAGRSSKEQQQALTKLQVKFLFAQVSAALAKTEETLVSARAPSAQGRTRAKQLAEMAQAMAADLPDAHYAMGDVLMDSGEPEAAEAEYRKALSANPDSISGHIKLADALRSVGKLPEVIVELREALRLDPTSAAAHTELGSVFIGQGKSAEAVSELQEAIRLDRDFIDAHNNLAIALARQQRIPEAVAEFREIVRIDPDSALGYYNLGIALADMDKDDESAAAFREVVRINPNHYNARFDLADLFRLEGKFDESVKQFREYLRLAPDTPQNQRNILRAKDFIQTHENR